MNVAGGSRGSLGGQQRGGSGETPPAPQAGLNGEERIATAFALARAEGRAALMPYMMAGYPDRETGLAVAAAYVDAGADLVELGVPFSDPLADGPTIHAAATAALKAGATLEMAMEICEVISERVREAFAAAGLALVPLVAPTTPAERRARICAVAQGFVYVVSTVGTTGERDEIPAQLADLVTAAQAEAEVPV